MAETRPRVVIVGAGFGGLACARKLDGEPVDVVLLDQHNYHLFTPLLYQVATGLLNPSDIAYPLRTVFRHSPNVRFRQATVTRVDLASKVVRLDASPPLSYDYLVLATGSTDNYFGNQDVARVSLGLKSHEDATRLRNLTKRGVAVRTGALVKSANGHSVTLSDGTAIACATIIWSAGVRPNDPVGEAPLPRFRNARIEVDPWMRIPGAPGAFAIGDAASPRVGDRELPMLSPPAMQAGRSVARAIADAVRGVPGEREPFHYLDKGTMATIGRNAGVTHLPGGLEFTG